jgi:hypothetical protein
VFKVAELAGKPQDHIRLVLCMLLETPIGLFLNCFVPPSWTMRYLYSMFMGMFLTTYMFRAQVIHVYLMSIGAYVLMTYMPRDS